MFTAEMFMSSCDALSINRVLKLRRLFPRYDGASLAITENTEVI